jgi:hypothetical protein
MVVKLVEMLVTRKVESMVDYLVLGMENGLVELMAI